MNTASVRNFVSNATWRNWGKLSVVSCDDKLNSRANKTLSTRHIIPKEYFNDIENIELVSNLVEYIKSQNISIDCAINSLCLGYLIQHDIITSTFETTHIKIKNFIAELSADYKKELLLDLPQNERDIIGIIYQYIMTDGEKNKKGSYYTPEHIISKMLINLEINDKTTILDPCCGSGGFLLSYGNISPTNLFGCDIDNIAVKMAKTNLIVKYADIDFMPNIVCGDFLLSGNDLLTQDLFNKKFDYIITNPPWGTKYNGSYNMFPQISSKEISSYFIVKASEYLLPKGEMRLVLPEAIMNIQVHKDCRKFILDNLSIKNIITWGQCFSGVQSNVVSIYLKNEIDSQNDIMIETVKEKFYIPQNEFRNNNDYIFSISNTVEIELLKKIYRLPYNTLTSSIWALGIVSGDNKKKLSTNQSKKYPTPILTGKEINAFTYSTPKHYFSFDRDNLQQVAKDEFYLASEKLLYKFISNKLVFAYDAKQQFVLNSANILIPQIDGMSVKTVLAFLNSKVMQFTYQKSFNQLKVIKSNLCKLPFPIITKKFDNLLSQLVADTINGNDKTKEIDNELYKFYNLTDDEIRIIKGDK
jgi:type I restriction-modification system DNA methylase subunit